MSAIIAQYLAIWNERDAARRAAAIKATLTPDSVYSDPDYAGIEGHAALSQAVGTGQKKFGDLVFSLGEIISQHHDKVLFTWRLGAPGSTVAVATGYDYVELQDGLISRVVGFF